MRILRITLDIALDILGDRVKDQIDQVLRIGRTCACGRIATGMPGAFWRELALAAEAGDIDGHDATTMEAQASFTEVLTHLSRISWLPWRKAANRRHMRLAHQAYRRLRTIFPMSSTRCPEYPLPIMAWTLITVAERQWRYCPASISAIERGLYVLRVLQRNENTPPDILAQCNRLAPSLHYLTILLFSGLLDPDDYLRVVSTGTSTQHNPASSIACRKLERTIRRWSLPNEIPLWQDKS